MEPTIFMQNAALIAMWVMTLSLFFPMYRVFRGPSLPDRIVALDQITAIVAGLILADLIYTGNRLLLDVVLVVSFLMAMGSMIIARYLYKQRNNHD
ncbi:monovalent cation/H+ antiporter complex subunit F [Geofilum sp. OHC36d9]|uniref:monovalent cation/H+ antiporter complex subunit F n=1 Tax=Geofilum sp. OHC36d9 TaxID=3458413 RepID=UPI0040343376